MIFPLDADGASGGENNKGPQKRAFVEEIEGDV
jgi:hypothetical protein